MKRWLFLLIIIFALIVVVSSCETFNYSDAAGHYEDSSGNWLDLKYNKGALGESIGTLFLEGEEYFVFWKYDLEKELMIISQFPIGNGDFPRLDIDINAHYAENLIYFEYEGKEYAFVR